MEEEEGKEGKGDTSGGRGQKKGEVKKERRQGNGKREEEEEEKGKRG